MAAYEPAFRASMWVSAEEIESPAAVEAALGRLDPVALDLALTLLVGVGAGETVPERLREAIEEDGEDLWRAGVLLPRGTPSLGATIDPRFYAAFCRVNGALGRHELLPELWESDGLLAHPPPTDARWDAVVVAARFEAEPARITQQGALRKDDLRRLLEGLGGDPDRWQLALALARTVGLVRPAAGAMHGFPESKPRPIADPASLVLGEGPRRAAEVLSRVAAERWVRLDRLTALLARRLPAALAHPDGDPTHREGAWLRAAADTLHRLGALDAIRDAEGVVAFRRPQPPPPRPPGFLLTPDRDILVAPGELPGAEYGRLCRLAPYRDGDVVHRHHLERAGVAADLEAGHSDPVGFLERRSRTGMPRPVRDAIGGWISAASRISLLTGATVLEVGGVFTVLEGEEPPGGARELSYETHPHGAFHVRDGELRVPFGADPLTVRASLAQAGEPLAPDAAGWRWRIAPHPVHAPDRLLDRLRRYHEGPLPGELEAAVLGRAGQPPVRFEDAVVVHLPPRAAEALRRDRLAGPLLGRALSADTCVVSRARLVALKARLTALGFDLEADPTP